MHMYNNNRTNTSVTSNSSTQSYVVYYELTLKNVTQTTRYPKKKQKKKRNRTIKTPKDLKTSTKHGKNSRKVSNHNTKCNAKS